MFDLQESDKHLVPSLLVEDLVQHCVLPYLLVDLSEKLCSPCVSMSYSLKILLKALCAASDKTRKRLMHKCEAFPLVLCLCQIVSHFRLLWDTAQGESEEGEAYKTMATHCLEEILSSIELEDTSQIKKGKINHLSGVKKSLVLEPGTSKISGIVQ